MFTLKVHFELIGVPAPELRRCLRLFQQSLSSPLNCHGNPLLELLARAVDGQFVAAIGARPERSSKLSEAVAYRITLDIEDRCLQPGDRLGSEADLLSRCGTGRGVLREALSLMELNGIVELRRGPHGGIFVGTPHHAMVEKAVCNYLVMSGLVGHAATAQRTLFAACGQEVCHGEGCADLLTDARAFAASQTSPVLGAFAAIFVRIWSRVPEAVAGAKVHNKDKD
jgi:DNA-binding transcriptional regulator YhcF (GntR family)